METLQRSLNDFLGQNGSIGIYNFAINFFTIFGLLSFPLCSLVDAPFGRVRYSGISINGTAGWFLMEIVSPLSFLVAIHLKPSSEPIFFSIPSLSTILSFSTIKLFSPIADLPPGRAIIATMFLLHYFNRAVISSFRNPSRARMSISVPLSAVLFNWLNGFMNGFFISSSKNVGGFGLIDGEEWKFGLGIICFFIGMAGNIYSDEVLYDLKKKPANTAIKSRYSIPQGFLYSYPFGGACFPNYFTEWIEWAGFLIATTALSASGHPSIVDTALPASLSYWQRPPLLFLINLIGVMLPRAISGRRWYRETFKDFPKDRWVVIPGLI